MWHPWIESVSGSGRHSCVSQFIPVFIGLWGRNEVCIWFCTVSGVAAVCVLFSACLEMEEAWSGRLLFGVWESCGACLALLHSCLVADKASGVNWLYGQIGCFWYWLANWQWIEQIFFGLHWTCRCYVACMGPIRWRHTPVCDRRKGVADVWICHLTHFYMTLPFHAHETSHRKNTPDILCGPNTFGPALL